MHPAVKKAPHVVLVLSIAATLAACASQGGSTAAPVSPGSVQPLRLGEPWKSSHGEVFVHRVQDEYQVIQCVPEGPIRGCFKDVFSVNRNALSEDESDGVSWNAWLPVKRLPGLEIVFLSPESVAFRELFPAVR
ncbi:MAG: hypothetical protein HMLKMBBP_00164 [Planctomycetes bacterium]|nr:hypothetical protein [Planctomycetota bacterium]